MRTRMNWDWVKGYPIFVFTTFLDNNRFHVKIVKGERGNQNAGGTGPNSPAWKEYIQEKLSSKDAVVKQALKITKRLLKIQRRIEP